MCSSDLEDFVKVLEGAETPDHVRRGLGAGEGRSGIDLTIRAASSARPPGHLGGRFRFVGVFDRPSNCDRRCCHVADMRTVSVYTANVARLREEER